MGMGFHQFLQHFMRFHGGYTSPLATRNSPETRGPRKVARAFHSWRFYAMGFRRPAGELISWASWSSRPLLKWGCLNPGSYLNWQFFYCEHHVKNQWILANRSCQTQPNSKVSGNQEMAMWRCFPALPAFPKVSGEVRELVRSDGWTCEICVGGWAAEKTRIKWENDDKPLADTGRIPHFQRNSGKMLGVKHRFGFHKPTLLGMPWILTHQNFTSEHSSGQRSLWNDQRWVGHAGHLRDSRG